MTEIKKFDAVVVGSGLGGLAAGALLAKAGYSVCLLERNFSLGGAASVYRVGGLTVESSLHQTSDARNPRDVKHAILRDLGILDEIEWLPTGALHHVRGGPVGETFALPAGFDAAYDALAERFPDKRSAIQEFLGDVERIHDSLWTMRQARDTGSVAKFTHALWELAPAAAAWNDTLDEVFTQRFGGAEALKCALGANLLYFGDDPKRIWWIYYALAQGANIASGGAYIKGGSRQLSLKLAKVITKAGGVVRLGRAATAILTDADGEAVGVRHVARKSGDDEQEISARVVLANCAPSVAGELLPEKARAKDGGGVWRAAALDLAVLRQFRPRPKARDRWPQRLQRDRAAGDDDPLFAIWRRRAARWPPTPPALCRSTPSPISRRSIRDYGTSRRCSSACSGSTV